jgi:hypothetical protein
MAVTLVTASTAPAQQQPFIFNVGPNTVDLSGSRCRGTFDYYPGIQYSGGNVRSGSTATTLYCPVPRRSTAFYGNVTSSSGYPIDTNLTISAVTMTAYDGATDGSVSCRPFAALVNGARVYGLTRYLCATAGGCSSPPASSFMGKNTMYWLSPFTNQSTINWGISCYSPDNSGVNQYEVVVTPNT